MKCRILSLLLNFYQIELLKTIVSMIHQHLKSVFNPKELKLSDSTFNHIPICAILKEDFSFIALKTQLTTLAHKFSEERIELSGFSVNEMYKTLNLEFTYSPGFRASVYNLLESAKLEVEDVKPYHSLTICSFKKISDLDKISHILENNLTNRLALPFQMQELVLSDGLKLEYGAYVVRPEKSEIYATFWSFAVWLPRTYLSLWEKMVEHVSFSGCRVRIISNVFRF